jgi:hypothetical protein
VEQELLTLPAFTPGFSGVRVTRSLVVCVVCFVDHCLSFCTFSFGHCVVCSSIYGFWLALWYLQTLLNILSKWKTDNFWVSLFLQCYLSTLHGPKVLHSRCVCRGLLSVVRELFTYKTTNKLLSQNRRTKRNERWQKTNLLVWSSTVYFMFVKFGSFNIAVRGIGLLNKISNF